MAKINSKLSTKLNSAKNYFIIRFKHIVVSSSSHVMYIHIHVIYVNNLCSDFNYLQSKYSGTVCHSGERVQTKGLQSPRVPYKML